MSKNIHQLIGKYKYIKIYSPNKNTKSFRLTKNKIQTGVFNQIGDNNQITGDEQDMH